MAPEKLSGQGQKRAAQLRWNPECRLCLHLTDELKLDTRTKAAVFSNIFRAHIIDCGFLDGSVNPNALRAQLAERSPNGKAYHNWVDIVNPPANEESRAQQNSMRDRIKESLQAIGYKSASQAATQQNTPHATPSSKRKRGMSVLRPTLDSDDDSVRTSRTIKTIRRDPVVVIPVSKPNTPRRGGPSKFSPTRASLLTPAQTPDKVILYRRYGGNLSLKANRHAKALEAFCGSTPPSDAEVHPSPLPPIFFRFWDEQDHVHNSESGFIAGRYLKANVMWRQPPSPNQIDPFDIFAHVEGIEGQPSPFITIIDSSKLDPRAINYARPWIRTTKPSCPYTKGKWIYNGSFEFLCWAEIPESAIIRTISIEDLLTKTNAVPRMSGLLRLGILMNVKASPQTLLKNLKTGNVGISSETAAAIGEVLVLLSFTPLSSFEQLSFMVAQICGGFAVRIEYSDNSQHQHYAAAFAHSFIRASVNPVDIRDTEKLHLAFLVGLIVAQGDAKITNLHAQRSVAYTQSLLRKAQAVGLENPAGILCKELDAAKVHVHLHHKSFERLMKSTPAQLLLEDGVEEDELEDELENEDEIGDGESLFEMDEEGNVL